MEFAAAGILRVIKHHERTACSICMGLVMMMAIVPVAAGEQGTYGLPEDPLAATVFEIKIHTRDAQEMRYVILQRLLDHYAESQGLVVTQDEIDAYLVAQKRFMELDRERREARRSELMMKLQSGRVTGEQKAAMTKELEVLNSLVASERQSVAEESPGARAYSEQVAKAFILRWKVNRGLYQQYGGRIIYQQIGPEPLDAYRVFLKEQEAEGKFKIFNLSFEKQFWRYFLTDELHDFYEPGSAAEAQAFNTPPWESVGTEAANRTEKSANGEPLPRLAGTKWRLVRFQSMDDAIGEIKPDAPYLYTLTLNTDGTVQMHLNCNRAIGTWSVEPAGDGKSGRFAFGPLTTTKALCPPPSMDERIAGDAKWISGYLLRDGQLHLSLMADGGIYSWEPVFEEKTVSSFVTHPDPELEKALRSAAPDYTREVVAITGREAHYVYGRVDLNADGRQEVLVLLMGSIFCGTGGCNLYLFSDSEKGYRPINNFPISRLPVIMSPKTTDGWHDLIRRESGGGSPPSYVRHAFNGEKYVEKERLPAEPTPKGTPLLDGDYSYATGFPLKPRSE